MRNPLYEQLYHSFVSDIKEGKIPSGSKLPSIRKCAEEKGLSLNTVQSAYEMLLSEGYVYAKEKSGFYVAVFEGSFSPKENRVRTPKVPSSIPKKNLINLSANYVDTSAFPYSTLRQLYRETLSGKNNEILEKSGDHRGDYALRSAISEFVYLHRGVNCSPDQVFIGNGTLFHMQMLTSFFGKDAVFFMEDPGFTTSTQIIRDGGTKVVPLPMDEEGIDMKVLKTNLEEKEESFVVHVTPSHEYPMGVTMSAPRRSSLLKWAYEKEGRYIVEDDYDSDFRYNGHPIPSLESMDHQGRVIYMGTFSRTLTPSMRISYMILPETLLERFEKRFGHYPCPVSRIDQTVIASFMKDGYFERHISRMRRLYRSKRNIMVSLLRDTFPRMEIKGEEAGLHFIVRFPDLTLSETKITGILAEKGVVLKGTGNGWLIVGYAHLSEEEMKKSVAIMKETLG